MIPRPRAILIDVEGTTTPVSFVREVLVPFARERMRDLLLNHTGCPEVAAEIAAIASLEPGREPSDVVLDWMERDLKIEPLKTLQGIIWRKGYESGRLRGALYPDVAPALIRWRAAGIRLAIFSSGSVSAQRLLFGYSVAGELTRTLSDFYDLKVGGKQERRSYEVICGGEAEGWLFLSDSEPELSAASLAGFCTIQLVRPSDGTERSRFHQTAADFDAVEGLWASS